MTETTTPAASATRTHPLLAYFLRAAEGRYPLVDGQVTVLPALERGQECSIAFTGHAVIATALSAKEVQSRGPDGFGASLSPDFLRWLAGPGGRVGTTDATVVAAATGGPAQLPVVEEAGDHPRVLRARERCAEVAVHGDRRGLVALGRGLAGRRELCIELAEDESAGRGFGRSLLRDALTLVPAGEPVFAAVSPGNARSLRAFLAAGFIPVGSEVLLRPARGGGAPRQHSA